MMNFLCNYLLLLNEIPISHVDENLGGNHNILSVNDGDQILSVDYLM